MAVTLAEARISLCWNDKKDAPGSCRGRQATATFHSFAFRAEPVGIGLTDTDQRAEIAEGDQQIDTGRDNAV